MAVDLVELLLDALLNGILLHGQVHIGQGNALEQELVSLGQRLGHLDHRVRLGGGLFTYLAQVVVMTFHALVPHPQDRVHPTYIADNAFVDTLL